MTNRSVAIPGRQSDGRLDRRAFLALAGAGAAAMLVPRLAHAQQAATSAHGHPNIVFILADDIGYGDLSCYGATKVKTANLDRLATQGIRFTDAHSSAAMCTPTRYALMTGEYAWRNRATTVFVLDGEAPLSIKPGRMTLPSMLKQAGYATGVVGKWHLGLGEGKTNYNVEIKPGPLELGFDYGFFFPATGDRVPCVFVEDHRVVGLDPKDPITLDYKVKPRSPETAVNGITRVGKMTGGQAAIWKDEKMAETLTDKAVAFIERHKDKPFFLYFPTHSIHLPRVPAARFRGTSQAGVRGDTIQELDWSVGEVMAALDRLNLTNNTLLIFSSDNGGVLDNGHDPRNGTVESNNGHAYNGPLSGNKGDLREGGHRVPFIARWPGHIPAGSTSGELICLIDLMATCAAITGQSLPQDAGPDTFNVLPALLGETHDRPLREFLVLQAGSGNLGIRQGPWMLIPGDGGRGGAGKKGGKQTQKAKGGKDLLFNLSDDLREKNNLAAKHPEKAKELAAILQRAREEGRTRRS